MMSYLVIPLLQIALLVSVMAAPVKTVKTSDYHSSNDININKPDEEESKQVINNIKDNENKINTLSSIIDNISKLSNSHNNNNNNNNNNKQRSSIVIKKKKYSISSNNNNYYYYNKKIYDSKIFYVRLPPAPYSITSLINLPIDFINNGKPSSVYQWDKPSKTKRSSSIIRLKKGPYEFNGRPTILFLIGSNNQTSVGFEKKILHQV